MSDDVFLAGGGLAVRASGDLLSRAGFRLRHGFELERGDRSPVIIGEVPNVFAIAREAVESGRHVLIANPQSLPPERLAALLDIRKRNQALFIWNDRRYHPGYHFVAGLIEADDDWRPRYLRLETLVPEPTSSALSRWLALEALTILIGIANSVPLSVAAASVNNSTRGAPDLISLSIGFSNLEASLQIGLGEAIERRETLLAARKRKAYVDELNPNTPVRIVEDAPQQDPAGAARWLSCTSPTSEELARQQVLSFLDATLKSNLAQDEATLWQRALSVIDAMDRSLAENGISVPVKQQTEEPRFRLILGRPARSTPPPSAA